ncbi:nucleoside hydrolase [Granulosicoccus antarcticus]|uniref:Pyrimidine-specific ribonucleoside hydrolase RihB n=1 Tax=Granulosicoccus antarcticus IMCC3135 TaxID=1192854 RepID=A0A2Z2NY21_9GAMM|nr:nucleoside hydrolase [Granulosicoccus antarcticus]ASJ76346.1 Pyrimidine-specific ribonucleoside hydrolase RihB [Granulosicoccus antarcticus IMCC3135]
MNKKILAMGIVATALSWGTAQAAGEKVIMDTDFSTIGDDGQVLIMASQLHAEGAIDLLGVTVVTGNNWMEQELAEALRAVERLGVQDEIGVWAGSIYPLVHDAKGFQSEQALFGFGESWQTALHRPRPTADNLVAPADGFAKSTEPQPGHAVDFIIDTVKANPGEVTLLVIGPVTNIAMAVRKAPEIVPMIKRIVYMGGAVDVRGNTTPAAEMNIWIDPEAARIVMREPIEQALIPLDVTNITPFTKAEYDRIVATDGPVQDLFRASWMGGMFESDPDATTSVYDTLALGYLVDPSFATLTEELAVDVDTNFGPGYGRTLAYWQDQPTNQLQTMTVIKEFDTARFFDFYIDLMTRPVPVVMQD